MIVNGRMTQKLKHKTATPTEWITQSGNFTTKYIINKDFTLPDFSETKTMTWKYHVDESTEGRHDIIISRGLLATLWMNSDFYDNTIECGEVPYQVYAAPMGIVKINVIPILC